MKNDFTLTPSQLGFKVFEPFIKQTNDTEKTNPDLLHIHATRGANAKGKITPDGFVIFKNSEIAKDTVDSYRKKGLNKLRDELIDNNIIVAKEDKLVFRQDYLFSSSSAAAMVVMGRSANGLQEWKNDLGQSLRETEKMQNK